MPIYAVMDESSNPPVVIDVLNNPANAPSPIPANWIDVTNLTSLPAQGWSYDGSKWTQPPLTIQTALTAKVRAALQNNAAFLALSPPLTNAQIVQQVNALTKQVNALIRLSVGELDSQSNT